MQNLSYWEKESFLKDIDVLIIGSGIVGLSAALHLKEKSPNLNIVIAERGTFPSGASTKNAGFSCFGSVSELLDDLEEQSEDFVLGILEKRWLGLQRLQGRVGRHNMNYFQHGNYEVFKANDQKLFEECRSNIAQLNQKLSPIVGIKDTFSIANSAIKTFGFGGVKQLIWNKAEGQIHTGKMMQSLLKLAQEQNIRILNGLAIKDVQENGASVEVMTEQDWSLQAKKVLVATNGFANKLFPTLEVRPARNQVLITKPMVGLPIQACFHYHKGYVYFRNIDNRILLGGARHLDLEGETTDEFGFSADIQAYLTEFLKTTIVPNQKVEIDYWWSGIMGIGSAKKPLVQKVSDNVAIAVRMGGMGIAIGSLIGEEGADLLGL
jgi:glycine/D-amino acid oxidase-like deaminating enzyme